MAHKLYLNKAVFPQILPVVPVRPSYSFILPSHFLRHPLHWHSHLFSAYQSSPTFASSSLSLDSVARSFQLYRQLPLQLYSHVPCDWSTKLSAFPKLTTRLHWSSLWLKNPTTLFISATSSLNYFKLPLSQNSYTVSSSTTILFLCFSSYYTTRKQTKGTPAPSHTPFLSHLSIITAGRQFSSSGSYFFSYTQSRTSHT